MLNCSLTCWLLIAVQLFWLAFQLCYLYSTHYVDGLTCVNLTRLRSTPLNLNSTSSWADLSEAQLQGILWWQNWSNDTAIGRLPIRGSHQSVTFTVNNLFSFFAKTQKLSLIEQLNSGVRALDIRLKFAAETNQLHAYHDLVDLNMSWTRIWTSIVSWLESFPSEGLLLTIRDETYNNHYAVATAAFAQIDRRTRERLIVLNNRQFRRRLTVGELRGRIFVWNINERAAMPWADDREFHVGGITVSDRYSISDIGEKLKSCQRFYDKLAVHHHNQLNVLFTSMANANVFRSIQGQALEFNAKFRDWLISSGQPIRGCVFMDDWVF